MNGIPNGKRKRNGIEFRIYIPFFKSSQEREIVSLEERSLELFGHEKFLLDSDIFPDGKGFLTRIGISEEQLKMVNYGEPFVFWMKQGKEMKDIQTSTNCRKSIFLSYFH